MKQILPHPTEILFVFVLLICLFIFLVGGGGIIVAPKKSSSNAILRSPMVLILITVR